jgi:hypothetical protein
MTNPLILYQLLRSFNIPLIANCLVRAYGYTPIPTNWRKWQARGMETSKNEQDVEFIEDGIATTLQHVEVAEIRQRTTF